MAVEAEPVGGAVVAGIFEETVLQELEREDRGLELQKSDLTLAQDQFLGDFVLRWRRLKHEKSVRMFEVNVKLIYWQNNSNKQSFRPPGRHPSALFPAPTPRSSKPPDATPHTLFPVNSHVPKSRAMSIRWTSDVPSPISLTLTSRQYRATG